MILVNYTQQKNVCVQQWEYVVFSVWFCHPQRPSQKCAPIRTYLILACKLHRYSMDCASSSGCKKSFLWRFISENRERPHSPRKVFRRQRTHHRVNWRSDDIGSQTLLQELLLPVKNQNRGSKPMW